MTFQIQFPAGNGALTARIVGENINVEYSLTDKNKLPQQPFSSSITLKVGISDLVILRPGFSLINVRI